MTVSHTETATAPGDSYAASILDSEFCGDRSYTLTDVTTSSPTPALYATITMLDANVLYAYDLVIIAPDESYLGTH